MKEITVRFYKSEKYYAIENFHDKNLFIRDESGQGMELSDEQIFDIFDKYFKENM